MRAHLVEEAKVRALADIVVVHRPEHGAEAVGIDDGPLAAVVAGAVADGLLFAERHRTLEEAGLVAPLERAEFLAAERFGNHRFRTRHEAPGDIGLARGMHSKDGEGVAVGTGKYCRDFRRWQHAWRGGGWILAGRNRHPALQISPAYCRIVRSDENQPIRAVLRTAFEYQADGVVQSWSISRCALA